MALFGFFKKKEKEFVQDDVFGKLEYDSFKNGASFYSGEVRFKFSPEPVSLIIHGDPGCITEEHKNFYQQFENNFDSYVSKVAPWLEDTFRNEDDEFRISDFNKEFSLVGLTIPNPAIRPLEWEITFITIHDHHQFTLLLKDEEPYAVQIDG